MRASQEQEAMEPEEYTRVTNELLGRLQSDPRVLGLVALGSMAARDVRPDRWSDHDFFVVAKPGTQESLRTDLGWLPRGAEAALSFRETAHGLKVVYADGHLLEFAVFDPDELRLARVNRYRVLLDREQVERRLAEVAAATDREQASAAPDDGWLLGQFLTSLLVGVGRFRRGERLSGRQLVLDHAVRHLLVLVQKHLPPAEGSAPDNLDPRRRFERAYPELGRELDELLAQGVPDAARGLIELASRELAGRARPWPARAAEAVLAQIGGT
jgi:hypothetical protein